MTVNGVREYKHRLVMNAPPGSVVHHKDGDRGNNNPDNLEIFENQSAHMKHHAAMRSRTDELKEDE